MLMVDLPERPRPDAADAADAADPADRAGGERAAYIAARWLAVATIGPCDWEAWWMTWRRYW